MKKLLFITFALLAAISCNQNKTKVTEEADITAEKFDSMVENVVHQVKEDALSENIDSFAFSQLLGDTLVAMQIWDEENTDVYKKYGYEFMGHCYACDAANILFSQKKVSFLNACMSPERADFDILALKTEGGKIVIESGKTTFVIERIEEAPIYTIKLKGDTIKSKMLRIAEFYTLKKELYKFEAFDCGEFDG